MDLPPVNTDTQNKPQPSPLFNIKLLLLAIIILIIGLIIGIITNGNKNEPQTITVTGTASMDINADTAILKGTFRETGISAEDAKKNGAQKAEQIKTALTNMGVSPSQFTIEDSYATQDYSGGGGGPSWYNNYPTPSPYPIPTATCLGSCPTPALIIPTTAPRPAYTSISTFKLELKNNQIADKDNIIQVLSLNNVDYPTTTYAINDKSKFDFDLKTKALQDARLQAENIAKLNNAKVIKIISVKEPNFESLYSSMLEKDGYTTKNITIRSSYDITYEIVTTESPFKF